MDDNKQKLIAEVIFDYEAAIKTPSKELIHRLCLNIGICFKMNYYVGDEFDIFLPFAINHPLFKKLPIQGQNWFPTFERDAGREDMEWVVINCLQPRLDVLKLTLNSL